MSFPSVSSSPTHWIVFNNSKEKNNYRNMTTDYINYKPLLPLTISEATAEFLQHMTARHRNNGS